MRSCVIVSTNLSVGLSIMNVSLRGMNCIYKRKLFSILKGALTFLVTMMVYGYEETAVWEGKKLCEMWSTFEKMLADIDVSDTTFENDRIIAIQSASDKGSGFIVKLLICHSSPKTTLLAFSS